MRPYNYTDDFVGSKIIEVLPIEDIMQAWPCIVIETPTGRIIQVWIGPCKTLKDEGIQDEGLH